MKLSALLSFQLLFLVLAQAQTNSSDLIDALRESKKVSVTLEELIFDEKIIDSDWKKWFPMTINHILDEAGYVRVSDSPDLMFVFRATISLQSADYVAKSAFGEAPVMRMPTGGTVKGTLRVEKDGATITTWHFDGSRETPLTTSTADLTNPITVAIAQSGIHYRLLSAVTEARGYDFLRTIVTKNYGTTVFPDREGRLATYQAVFPVLAAAKDPDATAYFQTLRMHNDDIVRDLAITGERIANEAHAK